MKNWWRETSVYLPLLGIALGWVVFVLIILSEAGQWK